MKIFSIESKSKDVSFPPPDKHVEGNDEPLGSFTISKRRSSLGDRIASHNPNLSFEYVTLLPSDGRTKKGILDVLSARKGRFMRTPVPLDSLPVIDMKDRKVEFSMESVLNRGIWSKLKNWVTLYEVICFFNPSQGFYDEFGRVSFDIVDYRKSSNQIVKHCSAAMNTGSSVYLSLDYAVHKDDLKAIKLRVECPASAVSEGYMWGSLRVELSLLQSNEAAQSSIIPVIGFIEVSDTALARHKHNPNSLDLTMKESNLSNLRKLRSQGKILNMTASGDDRKVSKFGGSEAGSDRSEEEDVERSDEGSEKVGRYLLGMMSSGSNIQKSERETTKFQFKPESPEPYMSVKEGKKPIRSAMKKVSFGQVERQSVEPQIFEFTNLSDVIKNIFSGIVSVSGSETKMSDFGEDLEQAIKFADEPTRTTQVYFNDVEKDISHINTVPFEDCMEMSIEDFYPAFLTKKFD